MKKIAIAVHGGACSDSDFHKAHRTDMERGMGRAAFIGYKILEEGGSAIDAVQAAVLTLEDDPLFNSGKGSALNHSGEVEMDATIMDGNGRKAGAVSMVKQIRNPIILARAVMDHTKHVLVSGYGAMELAKILGIRKEDPSYFKTRHQIEAFRKAIKRETTKTLLGKRIKGTVGSVAADRNGHLASATSTGGTVNCLPGRLGDSCIIGAGCYANDRTCAVAATGDGEYIITGTIAGAISERVKLLKVSLQEACDYIVHKENKHIHGDLGVISVNSNGEFGIAFNSDLMHRAWIAEDGKLQIGTY